MSASTPQDPASPPAEPDTALSDDDVVAVLARQHRRIRALFAELFGEDGRDARHHCFWELRTLLVVHETAEQLVVRPVSTPLVPPDLAERRGMEEKEATLLLADLEDIDVGCEEFDARLAQLESIVLGHLRAEEIEEFAPLVEHTSEDDRIRMGRRVIAAERLAPTRPHPGLSGSPPRPLATLGPPAAIIDRVRDAVAEGRSGSPD